MSPAKKKIHHHVVRAAKAVHRHAKDHFIPHAGNNHTPHVLQHRVLLGYSLALILLKAVVITVSLVLPSYSVLSGAITQTNIVSLTNEARKAQGLNALKVDSRLTHAAQAKAEDMLAKQYFAHTSPSGTTPWVWIRQAGYAYSVSGENLAVHYTTAEGTFAGWLASPSHRANIVSPKFTEIGVGIAEGVFEGHPSIIVVQMFGKPLATPSTAPPETAKKSEPAPAKPVAIANPTPQATTGSVAGVDAAPALSKPEPVASKPAIMASEAPAINTTSAKIKPDGAGYAVELTIENASSAVAQLGHEKAELEPTGDGQTWRTVLAFDPRVAASGGESLSVFAWNSAGLNSHDTLALIAPMAKAQELYGFANPNSEPAYRLFGLIPLEGLNDNARQIFLLTMVFLAACLLISILVRFHIQKPTIIVHTLVVMGLSALLFRL
jgi:hypothetical protein